MDNIIIKNGKAVEPKIGATAMPLGIEYEELQRRVQKTVEQKSEALDLRKEKKKGLDRIDDGSNDIKQTTFLLAPGTMMPYENTSSDWSAYPDNNVPSQNSERWIGR